jgi:hypothetical protein
MISEGGADPGADIRRYETLLEMADLMVHHHGLPELFRQMAERLRQVVVFDFANFSLHDPVAECMHVNVWAGGDLVSLPTDLKIDESPSGWVWQHQEMLNFSDLSNDDRYPVV